MKKCIQCTKDLPDAALHCVFCGSKQPAQAPAEMARTVMGYSANQVREQLQAPAAAAPARPRTPSTAPASSAPSAPSAAGASAPSSLPSFATSATVMAGPAAAAPAAASSAAPPAYQPPYQPPAAAPYQPPPAAAPFAATPAAYSPPASSFSAPAPAYQPPPAAPTYPSPAGYPPPAAAAPYPALAPASSANAATMFVPTASAAPPQMAATVMAAPAMGGAAAPTYGQPANAYQAGSYPAPTPMAPSYSQPFSAPQGYQPVPVSQPPPYLASQTADRAGRPIDPYRDGLRLVLFAFGILLLGAFCTPLNSAPTFHWNVILDAPGQAKVPSLLLAVIGALSIVIASVPMSSPARGAIALGLALLGIVVPLVLAKVTDWRTLLALGALLSLVPGLLLRQEYREHVLPRLLVTVGVIATLALLLVPQGGTLPLVGYVKLLVDAAGKAKVVPLLELVFVVVVILSLLVWLPAPSSGGAKLFAWILIFWGAVMHFQRLILSESLGEQIKQAPYDSAMSWAPTVAYLAILGYGLAAVLGKRLESA